MLSKIQEFLSQINPKWRSRKIKDRPEFVEYLSSKYPSYSLTQQVQFAAEGLNNEPLCPVCKNKLNDVRKITCSYKCSDILQKQNGKEVERKKKFKETMIERYGADNPMKIQNIRDKAKCTMMDRYGSLVSPKSRQKMIERAKDLNLKGRQTLKEKYGVDNPGQLPDHYEKCKSTLQLKYNVDNTSKIDHVISRRKEKKLITLQNFVPITIVVNNILSPSKEKLESFDNPNDIINFVCTSCNNQYSLPYETFKWRIVNTGTPCTSCSGISNGSLKEKELADYISSLGVKIDTNNRTLIAPKELDIVLHEYKLAFEFNGLFWHSDLRVDKNYHLEKTKLCESLGYQLIHIFEDEWDQKKDIVKHRIKNMLGLNDRIFARKCQIKEIDTATARSFIDSYHIQGYTPSTYKLGMFYDDCLVGVMTFAKPSKAKGAKSIEKNIWELSRFCSSHTIVGGASKFINHFIKNYDPTEVFSYSDNRWGSGDVYLKAGMLYESTTEPGYWYSDGTTRIHRYNLRKTKDDPKNITEYELRTKQGWYRIWDCGNKKFRWKKSPQ